MDSPAIYDEPSNSGCSEDEGDLLSHKNLCLDPVEEVVFLVDAHMPNTPSQEREECDYKGHTADAVIEAARDTSSLPAMAGLKKESLYHVLIDPVGEYMEAWIGLAPQDRKSVV